MTEAEYTKIRDEINLSIIRDKDWDYQYGVMATDPETNLSLLLGKFISYERAFEAIERFTGKARTIIY